MADSVYLSRALVLARKSLLRGNYPSGCVIIKNNKVIAESMSSGLHSPDPTAHAELIAIRKACKKIKSRSLANGVIVYSNIEPCLMCAKAMVYARVKKVIFSTSHGEYGAAHSFDILKENGIGKKIVVVRLPEKESDALLEKFLRMHQLSSSKELLV